MDCVRVTFSGSVILRFGDIVWAASCPNLSVPCHFLWGQLTAKVRANKPDTPEELKEHSRDGIRAIDKACCVRLWLISDHAYRNVLYATETTKEMQFLKSEERALYGILLLLFYNCFSDIQPNSSKQ